MSKLQDQALEYISTIPETGAEIATEIAWTLAQRHYVGKRISDRRIELYVNAILDLRAQGLISVAEDDQSYYGSSLRPRRSWLDDRTDEQRAHDNANIQHGRRLERAEIIEYLEDYSRLVRQGRAEITLDELIDNIEGGLPFVEGVRQC